MTVEFPTSHRDLTVLLREERRGREEAWNGTGRKGHWVLYKPVGERMMLAPHEIQRDGDF